MSAQHVHIDHMDHIYYVVDAMQKDRALMNVIELENPGSAIIFCNTKREVEYLTTVFQRFGYDVDQLTGDLSQAQRERVMARVKAKNLRFLIATDIAARGIDISLLTHVFHYSIPEDQEIYVHRSGRTARAGSSGTAIALADVLEEMQIKKIAKTFDIDMEKRLAPTPEEVQNRISERLMIKLEQELRSSDRARKERLQRFIPLAKTLTVANSEPELLAMLLDNVYVQMIHRPAPEPAAFAEPEAAPQESQAGSFGHRSAHSGQRRPSFSHRPRGNRHR
jgi:ATP-dependent RNA helicase DeaD